MIIRRKTYQLNMVECETPLALGIDVALLLACSTGEDSCFGQKRLKKRSAMVAMTMTVVEPTYRMRGHTILLGVLDRMELCEIMTTQRRLSVDHQRRVVTDDGPDVCLIST